MERGHHFCPKHPCFATNFKVMFNHGDPQLFNNSHLHFIINSDIESQKSLAAFIEEIGNVDLKKKYPNAEELIKKYTRQEHEEEKKQVKEEVKQPPPVVNSIIEILK
jgi:hypothetical protein